jgi:hypothetical protein
LHLFSTFFQECEHSNSDRRALSLIFLKEVEKEFGRKCEIWVASITQKENFMFQPLDASNGLNY